MSMNPRLAAQRVLDTWWQPGKFPVDPVRIAHDMGLDVREVELPSTLSGALVKTPGYDAIILLEARDHMHRKRFTCAHELGHFIHRSETGTEQADLSAYQFVDLRGDTAATGLDPIEVFANQFAAHLLMPEDAVRAFHREDPFTVNLARIFGVSAEAMGIRLAHLHLRPSALSSAAP